MLAAALACAMNGVEGTIVRVEADTSAGTPSLAIIGLPDRSLHESKDRVRAALALYAAEGLLPAGKSGALRGAGRLTALRRVPGELPTRS